MCNNSFIHYCRNFLFIALLFSIGCQPTEPPAAEAEAEEPAFDLAAAKAEIEAANQKLMAGWASGDPAQVAACYTKDTKFMEPNKASMVGRAAVEENTKGGMEAGINKLQVTIIEVWGNKDMIVEEGSYTVGNEEATFDQGKYMVLWKKEDGEWKLHRDIYNSDNPLPSN